MPKSRRSHRNDLGSLFAASIVTVLGAVVCAFLFVVSDPHGSPWTIAVITTVAVLLLGTIIGVRVPRMGAGLGFWNAFFGTRAGRDETVDYEPRPVKITYGTGRQRPITVDEVRDLRELSTRTWVPSRGRTRQSCDHDRLD